MEATRKWIDRRYSNRGLIPQSAQLSSNEPNGDPMDWEPIQTFNIASAQRNMTHQTQQTNLGRASWVSREETRQRIATGLCFRCGGRGYQIKTCSLLPGFIPNRQSKNLRSMPNFATASVLIDQESDNVAGNA
ncbi:hypothetical protein OnM2_039037c [Erysiphe neolycopersici]|uniref:CCHC-type domain-containing protein n=1 Tax=Erysiphe neolycopersici TaxID=212602 RepID=A0A420HWA8_9PEZI|nr:hypothetical protein OnM2_039037c [Erysiphe neolycopersici]